MGIRVWGFGILILLIWGGEPTSSPTESAAEAIFGFRDSYCPADGVTRSLVLIIVGDEVSLQRALNLVHKNSHEYVAVLFYASWCPSQGCLSQHFLFWLLCILPSHILHLKNQPSGQGFILSKYGVHGFPTLFILNSTMRVRYQGARTPGSLIAFYSEVTGIKTVSLDQLSLEKAGHPPNHEKNDSNEQESCPFSWARSPENLLRQETYLALASAFVILRLLYIFFPTLISFAQSAWRRHVRNVRFGSLFEHPVAYLKRAVQLFNSLKEPCKRSNLQEGAMNARVWASKSLATVSIGDASTSRGTAVTETR
ncbi:putative thioredoxin-like protein [Rosa chinensis]|uniref:Putative thioredoxin-like protein n=1 Tax=Rosa chinensis TaxID=74649 RepID=A0A2P6PIW6_ROSCH|nr:putative thioredoxin-like protein [Rosa chinensis]